MSVRNGLLALAFVAALPVAAHAQDIWAASWAASPAPPLASSEMVPPELLSRVFRDQTIDQIVRLSVGGTSLRVRLTNEYGTKPLAIGEARIALVDAGGKEIAGTQRTLTFSGRGSASIPAGAPWLSDPVGLHLPQRARLKISLYLPEDTGLCTCHGSGGATAFISPPGNFVGKSFKPSATYASRAFLSEVDVRSAAALPAVVVVAFGDSITDGYLSTNDTDRRWPDRLAERLAADPSGKTIAVANAGIGGNRILKDGAISFFGQSAVQRFDRDVLSVPGVSTVIMLEGINDIGMGTDQTVSAEELIAGYRQIIARAHAKRLKIVGGTLLPFEGADYYRPQGEVVRQAVNRWIRTSGAFDAIVDFDAAMRDPARPGRLRADLQSGDWLHPNDAGYRVMGDTVSLSLLR